MRIKFSETETIDLLWAWAAISFAFAVLLSGGLRGIQAAGSGFIMFLVIAAVTVGVGFIFHELAHKIIAQKYGCWAEFRRWNFGLILAVTMSFLGFIFAAPGAVMISGMVSKEQNGKISVAGPLTNIILALLFLFASYKIQTTVPFVEIIIFYGFLINAWLALFNMIPFPPFDGSKVMAWSFPVWLGVTAAAGFMVFFI